MTTLDTTAETIGALIIILGFLWAAARGIIRIVRFGIRVETSLSTVETELRPNGGGSLRDRVDQLGHQHNQIMNTLTVIEHRLHIVEEHK